MRPTIPPAIPWRERVKTATILVGVVLGVLIGLFLPTMIPFVIREETTSTAVTITYSAGAYLLYLLIGGGMILAALKLGFDRQLYHWAVLGGGVAVVVIGCLFVTMEKVEITRDSCSSRTWFGLSSTTLHFSDLQGLRHVHQRVEYSWYRKNTGPRPSKLVYVTVAGEEGIFLSSYYPSSFYNNVERQLLLAWALHRKDSGYPVQRK